MNTKDTINLLQTRVDDLKRLFAFQPPAEEQYTIGSALAALKLALPDERYLDIIFQVPACRHETKAVWRVWDGHDHYEGPTLGQAMQACLAAHQPKPPVETVIQDAEAILMPAEF